MDFDSIAQSVWNQLVAVWNAPVPFLAALLLVGYAIWRIVQWQHNVRIVNLSSQLDLYREASAMTVAASTAAKPCEERPIALLPQEKALTPARHESEQPEGRVFVPEEVTLATLQEAMWVDTFLAGQKAIEPYIGKWMHLSGTVENLIAGVGEILVSLRNDSAKARQVHPTPSLWFAGDASRLQNLRKGDPIKAIGRLESVEPLSIMFVRCELAD